MEAAMKKSWSAGDRSRAFCEYCESVVETRFEYRTYALSTPRVDVPEVLVAVCSVCNRIAAVPYQSSARLNEARKAVVPAAQL
jgi:RNase P subunit RPR2